MSAALTTRRGLLAAGAGLLAAPVAAVAAPADGANDGAAALVEPLRTQLLALACYDAVMASRSLPAGRVRRTVVALREHERAHVAALRAMGAAAGGRARLLAPGPALDRALARERITGRPGHLRGVRDALNLLLDAERVTIGAAYLALGDEADPGRSVLIAQIMASGAQHEAILHEQLHPGDVAGAIPYGIVQGLR